MSRRPPASASQNKRRTREHVIGDLGINHVERQVLLAGHTVERRFHDYGIDLVLWTYSFDGATEPGNVFFQVKATDHLASVGNGKFVRCRIERAHLRAWLSELEPVILIVYDATMDRAYWLYVQAVYGGKRRFQMAAGSERLTIRIPTCQILNREAIEQLRQFRDRISDQIRGVIHHD